MLQADREFSGERQRDERLMSFKSATFSVIFVICVTSKILNQIKSNNKKVMDNMGRLHLVRNLNKNSTQSSRKTFLGF